MSFLGSLFSSSSSTDTTKDTTVNPWGPAIPTLQQLIQQINGQQSTVGATPGQSAAFGTLEKNAAAGDPWTDAIKQLTDKMFGTQSQAPTATDAYSKLTEQLTPYADGSKVNVNDPALRAQLDQVGNDVTSRINSQFAGAGRDLSGMNQKAIASGLASSELPIMSQWIQQQQANQLGAAGALQTAGAGAAAEVQGLNKDALGTAAGGIDASKSALNAQNYGPNSVLALEQQMKSLSSDDLRRLLGLILPAAGLGGASNQVGTSNTTSTPSLISSVGGIGKIAASLL